MTTLFAIGTLWFWVLLVAAFICILWALEDDEYPGTKATITCIVTLALIYFLGGRSAINDLFSFVAHNPLVIAMAFGGYLLAGTVWSVVKWYFFVLNARDKYREDVSDINEEFNSNMDRLKKYIAKVESGEEKVKDKDSVLTKYKEEIERRTSANTEDIARSKQRNMPSAKGNKSRILTWMFYWPFSGIWTIINDPVRRAFQWIYKRLEGVYQKITVSAFEGE